MRIHLIKHTFTPISVFVLSLAGSVTASAQTESTPASELAPIVVTGKAPALYEILDVNLGALGARDPLDVPLTIQSYAAPLIENQRAKTLNDVLKNDASVQNTAVGGAFDNISIRGFPVDWTNSMRRDGLAIAPYQDVPLEDVERIDVLKGPSGFLYGFNAPGGTVNYVLKRPTRDNFTAVTTEVRDHGGLYAHIDSGGPLGEEGKVGYRVNLATEKQGDFTHNGDLRRNFISGALDWKPTDKTFVRLDFDYQDKELAAQPVLGVQPDGALPPMPDPRTLLGQPWLRYKTKTYNVGGRFDYYLNDDWSVTTQVAYSHNTRQAAFPDIYEVSPNGDILSGDIYYSPNQKYGVLSGQTFVTGLFKTGSIEHDVVAGLSTRQYRSSDGGFTVFDTTVGNIFDPVYSPEPDFPDAKEKIQTRIRENSVYLSDTIKLNEQWQVIGGLRHIQFRSDVDAPGSASKNYSQSTTVPAVGIVYKPVPDLSLYTNYTQGVEQGGFAPFNSANAGESLKPMESEQYEVGAKYALSDRLNVGIALFEIKKGLEYVNSSNVYVSSGEQRHRGLELSATGQILPGLSLVSSVAWLQTRQENTGDPSTDGKRAANAPSFQGSLFLDYALPFAPGLNANAGFYYVGSRPLNAANTATLPSYNLVDLGLRYQTKVVGHKTTFRANVNNVADKRYWAAANYGSVYAGMGRTFALSATMEF